MAGSTFDNNIPCIAEKEIIAVESVAITSLLTC